MQNFKDMTDFLLAENVLFKSENEEDLTNSINNAFNDEGYLKSFDEKTKSAVDKMTGATEILISAIREKLNKKD